MYTIDKDRYQIPETECQEDVSSGIICQSKDDYIYKDLDNEM